MDDRSKFRVWLIDEKRYAKNDGLEVFAIDQNGEPMEHESCGEYAYGKWCRNHIVEHCTGRRDSKRTDDYPEGQLIYEGEILCGTMSQVTREVVWDKDNWCGRVKGGRRVTIIGWQDYEIVGNVNENPELMK